MNIKLPITQWFSYTAARHICGIDWNYPPSNSNPEVHLISHRALSDDALWANEGYRNMVISESVAGLVEAARIAFNADTVAEAKDDPSLVPLSCLTYLDGAVIYTMAMRGFLYIVLPMSNSDYQQGLGTKTYLKDLYYEEWLDCMVYLRAIRDLHRTEYKVEPGQVESSSGTPAYLGRIPKARSL